jgi:glycosyltransferase involved in cell wall biosynthesis
VPTVHAWGTWDDGKPRTRLLLQALQDAGVLVRRTHVDVWSSVVDKSQLRGVRAPLSAAWRWSTAYGRLLVELLRHGDEDVVFVGYLGHLDVLVAWPLARWRGQAIVWDAFLSLYDTVVDDRRMAAPGGVVARVLWWWEWLACRAADVVVLDTAAHAAYFRSSYGLAEDHTAVVFVGAEDDAFAPVPAAAVEAARADTRRRDADPCDANGVDGDADSDADGNADGNADGGPVTVLFYGQFIPLHGIRTIIEAARRSDPARVHWVVVGTGQETARIEAELRARPVEHLTWHRWVDYEQLRRWIVSADVCLGVFGASDKAGRVIPNKVFQVLSVGRPLITRDSPGIRELLGPDDDGVLLVPPEDPSALLAAVERIRKERPGRRGRLHADVVERFARPALARAAREAVVSAARKSRT